MSHKNKRTLGTLKFSRMNPFAYLGRASSPEMAGVGPPDPQKTKIVVGRSCYHFVHFAATLELAPLVCWHVWVFINHSSTWLQNLPLGSYRSLSQGSRGLHAASQSTHEMHSSSASTSMSCVPNLLEGMLLMMMMPNPTLHCVRTCVRACARACTRVWSRTATSIQFCGASTQRTTSALSRCLAYGQAQSGLRKDKSGTFFPSYGKTADCK